MAKKIEKENDLKFEDITPAENNSGIFLSAKKSDNFKKVAAPAVVSDQITLFDEEEPNNLALNEKPATAEQEKTNATLEVGNKEEVKEKKFNFLDFNRAPKNMLEIETTPEEETEKLGEAEETVKKQSSKKKKIWSLIFFLINIGVVAGLLVYQLMGDAQMTSISELFSSGINWGIFVFALFLTSLTQIVESAKVWLLTWKTTGKNRPFLAYKVCSLGKHYDAITPLSAGGEPFQVYYMNKHGIPASKAVSIPVGIYVMSQISFVVLGLICMIGSIFLPSNGDVGTTVISASSWIGFSLNFLLIFLVVLVSINKKIGHGLITGILKGLKKMRIIKDKQYESIYNKAMNLVGDYQKTMKGYAKNLGTFFTELFLSFGSWILRYCMPYIVYSMFFGFHPELFIDIFVKTVMIELASTFIPLPGGTGMAELSFTAFFSALMGPNIFWAMLFWRILTHYSFMIRGVIIIIYDYARGNKKQEWLEKKWKLEEESKQFEEAQLKDFEISLMKQNKKKRKEK